MRNRRQKSSLKKNLRVIEPIVNAQTPINNKLKVDVSKGNFTS